MDRFFERDNFCLKIRISRGCFTQIGCKSKPVDNMQVASFSRAIACFKLI